MSQQPLTSNQKAVLVLFSDGPMALPLGIDFVIVEELVNRGLLRRIGAQVELTRVGVIVLHSMSK